MKIHEQLSSKIETISPFISRVLEQIQKERSLNEDDIFCVKLGLEESLTNAVKHGNKFSSHLKVDAAVSLQKDLLTIKVKDHGQGFDVHTIPDPTTSERLMKTSGRGIFLLKKIMDEVTFHDTGREICMVKKFSNHQQQ